MRVLVFGASITQGFYDLEGGWVNWLRKHYDQQKISGEAKDPPTVFNLGISADTVQDVLKRFKNETEARKRHGDLVFIFSIGTNNAGKGHGFSFKPNEYRNDLKTLVGQAKEYSKLILIVGLPPCDEKITTPIPWADVYYTNDRIKKIENQMREIAEEQRLPFVPIFETFKAKFESGEDLFFDGLHPNGAGHELIARLVQPELEKLLTA
jgi:lysophospholipase L1-like esterase